MRLSIIVPVFNERATVRELLRRVAAVDLDKEVVVTGRRPPMTGHHRVGNRLLTAIANALYGSALTDMETCYELRCRRVLGGFLNRVHAQDAVAGGPFAANCEASALPLLASTHEVPSVCGCGRRTSGEGAGGLPRCGGWDSVLLSLSAFN